MKSSQGPTILILGATGMLGRVLYSFLKQSFPQTYGTSKQTEGLTNFFFFSQGTFKRNFEKIIKRIKNIDYVINCIGILKDTYTQELIYVNALLPHKLLDLSKQFKFKIIHVSSDAVFSSLAGKVDETCSPFPNSNYGASKLLGELFSSNALTVRTSIIGLDPIKHKGILEWAKRATQKKLHGFTNQKWTGCTTFQFAQLCRDIISKNKFKDPQAMYHILHFAPLGPITKYKLLSEFLQIIHSSNVVEKSHGEKITRMLVSRYLDSKALNKYTRSLPQALKELLDFEKKLI